MENDWSDLRGEPETGYVDVFAYCRKSKGIHCKVCECLIEFDDMKPWRKDDETVDLLCPWCDSVLVEGE